METAPSSLGCSGCESVANLREHRGGVRAVAFSTDGKRVASASEDQWNVESGQKEAVLVVIIRVTPETDEKTRHN